MADVPVTNPTTGEIRMVPEDGVKAFTEQTGWSVSTAAQKHAAKLALGGGMSAGEVVQGAGEKAVRTATFGLLGPQGQAERDRQAALAEEHPYVAMGAQAAGSLAPALVAGALTGGAGTAIGLSGTEAGLFAGAAEGLAGGGADEVEQARAETRDVSAGNILLFGLGGEIAGRALPHALSMGAGKVRRALTAVEAAAGEGVPSALAHAEARSVESQARIARDLPTGSAERAAALRDSAPHQYERMATESADDLGKLTETTARMGETNAKRVSERLRETMAEPSPAQTDWFTATRERLDAAKRETRAPLESKAEASVPERAPMAAGETLPTPEAPLDAPGAATAPTPETPVPSSAALNDAALEYAQDAARRRLRGVADHTGNAEYGELAGTIGERSESMRGLSDDVKRAINERTGKAHLDDIVEWTKNPDSLREHMGLQEAPKASPAPARAVPEAGPVEFPETPTLVGPAVPGGPEPLPAAAPARAPRTKTLANAPGMRDVTKEFDSVIDKGLKRLDKTTDTAEQYLVAREVKQQLQRLSDKVAALTERYPVAEQMQGVIDGAWQHVAEGLTDKSLFGAAADIEREISSPFRDKIAQSLGTVEQDLARSGGAAGREFDPKKIRAFLKGDKVDRAVTQGHLERVLEGAEEQLAAHERHGTWEPRDIAASRERIARIRESIGLADEIHVAKQEAIPAASKAGAQSFGEKAVGRAVAEGESAMRGLAESGLESIVNHVVPFGGTILKLGKRILGMDGAARAATKQVARNLAGVGAGYAERALGGVARGTAGAVGAVGAMTALQRFTGDYSGPEESWEAKKKLLDDEQVSPDVLYEVLGHTLGDLPKVNPELFQQIAARTAGKIRYMRENLPPGLQVSLLYPNGTPPSQSALRDFATQWNTVMDPETVLHDIDSGTATPLQMKTLKDSDRDLYDQLRGDCIEQVGTHFADVPMSTKLQLDLLFEADGLAGPMFSSAAADMVGEAMAEAAKRAPAATQPSSPGGQGGPGQGSGAPSGIEAIKTSVTNRGTGA